MSKFISLTGLSEFLTKCRALFYTKPSGGIPSSDLASAIQTSLGKADSAYQKPNSGIPKTDLASGVQSSLDLADSSVQANPVGSVTPAVDPYDYATREEVSQLGQKLNNLAMTRYYGIFTSSSDLPEDASDLGYAYVGASAPFAIYEFDGNDWTDTGATINAIQGEPGTDGVGFASVASAEDGTVVITLSNGDTVTLDLNHNHPAYPRYTLLADEAAYIAIVTKESDMLYLIPES